MTAWYKSNLGDAMLATAAVKEIETSFLAAYQAGGQRKGMAAFIRHESEGQLHCDLLIYFSPAAADFAKQVGATPCPKPAGEGLSLLAGDAACI